MNLTHDQAQLAVQQDDDVLIDAVQLADMLRISPAALYQLRWREKQAQKAGLDFDSKLPKRAGVFGRRLVWHLGTVRAWIRERANVSAEATEVCRSRDETSGVEQPENRTGRPRKSSPTEGPFVRERRETV
ncbi:helix-turn-helix transcriptional regulator [Burkholderia vietnamiensis]|uniref:helix-turn-helix transcriptional regulator n=1 Tax=Burkholderia vietnamiensis TaxID=60552 RepID=UPI0012DB2F27|nr:hypothetical protein [Burkholderia vietnamiensis]